MGEDNHFQVSTFHTQTPVNADSRSPLELAMGHYDSHYDSQPDVRPCFGKGRMGFVLVRAQWPHLCQDIRFCFEGVLSVWGPFLWDVLGQHYVGSIVSWSFPCPSEIPQVYVVRIHTCRVQLYSQDRILCTAMDRCCVITYGQLRGEYSKHWISTQAKAN